MMLTVVETTDKGPVVAEKLIAFRHLSSMSGGQKKLAASGLPRRSTTSSPDEGSKRHSKCNELTKNGEREREKAGMLVPKYS